MTISNEYQNELQKRHQRVTNWGSTGERYAGGPILGELRSRPYVKSVLDFGCGKGSLGRFLASHTSGVQITGYDPGIDGLDSPPTGRFDMVVSSDVLEHVEPDNVESTILQIADLSNFVMCHDIACSLTGDLFDDGPYKGQDLHISCHDPDWWKDTFLRTLPGWFLHEYAWKERQHTGGRFRKRCWIVMEAPHGHQR